MIDVQPVGWCRMLEHPFILNILLEFRRIRLLTQNGDGAVRGRTIIEKPLQFNFFNSFLLLFEPVINWRLCHQVIRLPDELFKILLICEHLNIIEPTTCLEVSKFVYVNAKEH